MTAESTVRFALLEPTAIDPYRAQEVMGIPITKALYDGLLRLDASGRLAPGVAEDWSCSPDGCLWEFRLRRDSFFSTGEPVTAEHFVHAWNRALSTTADSETTYHLAGIEGYQDRGPEPRLSGLWSEGPTVLRVRLSEPDFEFDKKTLQPICSPVLLDSGPADDPRHNAQPIGNGPFRLAEPWVRGVSESITLVPNEHYRGTRPAGVRRIEISVLAPESAIEDESVGLRSGRFHLGNPPQGDDPADSRFEVVTTELTNVIYLLPFLHRGLLADRQLRFALNHAFDREEIVRTHFGSAATVATSLIPPALPTAHRHLPERVVYDPDLARSYAAQSRLQPGDELFLAYNIEGNHEPWLQTLRSQVEANLGLKVKLVPMTYWEVVEFRTSLAAEGACRAGWVADYPTPDNFLFPLLHSSCTNPDQSGQAHGDNEGRYANDEFDALISKARAERDEIARGELYAEAEALAIGQDLALIPLWYSIDRRWYDPAKVTGVRIDAFGYLALDELRPGSGADA